MELVFRKTFTVSDNTTDRFDRMRPSTLLFFAQEAAISHCAQIGMDWSAMAAKKMFWAITRTKVEILRMPRGGETVTVETWPMANTRVAYPRATVMYDASGAVVMRSVSLWVLMDMEKRSMILPGKSGLDFTGEDRGGELKPPAGLPAFQSQHQSQRVVRYSDIDVNGHLNNARYLDWVNDLMDCDFHGGRELREMIICYVSEAREGQELTQEWSFDEENQQLLVQLRREDDRVFSAKLTYEIM